ncbi:hypothetical protein JYU34_014132 [Plutella xylostella]|uniref:Reverse transcriptase domain-containing protein n=1 Tax=Plutella xylostella TaxID=51655 RepID=A0ABQ7Q942_PLUXY|nr:hypothetical protein JYU34_014132 [Plutella xylostella]
MKREVEKAIDSLQNEKSAGPDGINSELLKIAKENLIEPLTDLFNQILEKETVPAQWLTSTIILLFKKGSTANINDYRPITLTSNIYKCFAKVILARIAPTLDEQQPVEQAGFRKGFSTSDHLHVMQQLIEKTNEYPQPLYIAFIDFTKAFDSIEHCYLWEALYKDKIEPKYIALLKHIYDHSSATIKLDQSGPKFNIEKGVKQGDSISPKLFNSVLEHIFKKCNWQKKGININGKYMSNIRFADDIALFASTKEELQDMLSEINIECNKVGLYINKKKTKVMYNTAEILQIQLEGETLETVNDFIYLGRSLSFQNNESEEINRRIANTWKRFWQLKHIFKNKRISIKLKSRAFDTCLLPILTYGAQTWALTKKDVLKLKTTQRKIERSMLSLRLIEKTTNKDLRNITKVTDVIRHAKRLKWKWAGHVMRLGDGRWTREVTEWSPRQARRRRGRPRVRWRDELEQFSGQGVLWTRLTQYKHIWKRMGEAFAQQWDHL